MQTRTPRMMQHGAQLKQNFSDSFLQMGLFSWVAAGERWDHRMYMILIQSFLIFLLSLSPIAYLRFIQSTHINITGKSDHSVVIQDWAHHHPCTMHNAVGVLRCKGSEAEEMVKLDVCKNLDANGMTQVEIYHWHAMYKLNKLMTFCGHIHQAIKCHRMFLIRYNEGGVL